LKATGIDSIWIPPACKGAGGKEANGYDVYDLYDVGEFDQKGAKATKWGTKEELMELCEEAQKVGVGVYFDAVCFLTESMIGGLGSDEGLMFYGWA
jgi:alpha-amylase